MPFSRRGATLSAVATYLNDHGEDFTGGKFVVFKREQRSKRSFTLEPKAGDCIVFYQELLHRGQSSYYLRHSTEQVASGVRYAMRAMVQYAFRNKEEALTSGIRE